jgi:hypothetical protein
MSSGIFVYFFECEILMLAEVESVEAEGVIRLIGGRPQVDNPHGQQPTGLGITERMTTVSNISGIG